MGTSAQSDIRLNDPVRYRAGRGWARGTVAGWVGDRRGNVTGVLIETGRGARVKRPLANVEKVECCTAPECCAIPESFTLEIGPFRGPCLERPHLVVDEPTPLWLEGVLAGHLNPGTYEDDWERFPSVGDALARMAEAGVLTLTPAGKEILARPRGACRPRIEG